ncbi:MAG: HDOD domain-containing protein, partial [Gammaproteobacteria bacterium]
MHQLRQPLAHSLQSKDLPTLEQIVGDVSALITPPTVCVKMYDLVRSEKATAADIGQVVAMDPNLTGRLLKIVNSAYFGFSARIDTIERAVNVIGVRDLYNLVLAITAVRSFSGLNSGLISMDVFWRHSVMCGLTARELAKTLGTPNPERFFVAGLLHDIGILVMYSQLDGHVADMRAELDGGEHTLHAAELERF